MPMRVLCLFLSFFLPVTAMAQEQPAPSSEFQLTEPTQEILPLRRGAMAPRDGLLIDAADLLQIRADYERLRYLLTRTAERDAELCDVRVAIERAHTAAAEERLTLRDGLWNARQAELVAQVARAQEQAQRAAERSFWEHPGLWAAIGGAIVGLVWVATAVR
jgi:hypothetical protein